MKTIPARASCVLILGFLIIPLSAFADTKPVKSAEMETKAVSCCACSVSVSATDARSTKVNATRAKRAKSISDWFKFAFDKDDSPKPQKFNVWRGPSREERIKNRSEWLDFAFDQAE